MSDAPYVNFYTSDFLAGTSGMTAATKGVYITLTCLMYEAEAPLHQSWDMLARRCGATLPAFRKAIEALQDDNKMLIVDGGLWSPKCDKHIALRRDRQKSAKAAAEIRWQKSQQKQSADDAGAYDPQCYSEPEPDIRKSDGKPSLAHLLDRSRFAEFWDQYPHRGGAKKGKASAQKVWDRLVKAKVPQDQIIAGAERYAGDRQVMAGFAKDPATWLNARGWEDEIETGAAPGGVSRYDRKSEGRAFGAAINKLADGLSSGTVQLDFESRNPFAQR